MLDVRHSTRNCKALSFGAADFWRICNLEIWRSFNLAIFESCIAINILKIYIKVSIYFLIDLVYTVFIYFAVNVAGCSNPIMEKSSCNAM